MHRQYKNSCYLDIGENQKIKFDYYIISESKVFLEEKTPRLTYGIEIIDNNNESRMVKDISTNEEKVIDIINILIRNVVSPIHLKDIIEDMI